MTVYAGEMDAQGAHNFVVRVYFEDTDFSTNVYHASYLKFFERGRTEFLRAHNLHHASLAELGLAFAVRSMEIHYDRAAHIDDVLCVKTFVSEVTAARVMLEQVITRDDLVITRAKVVAVLMTLDGKPKRLPKDFLEIFRV